VQFNKVCRHAGGQALRLTGIEIDITTDASSDRAHILTSRRLQRPTGVEREVLAAATVAALTIYDMCKAVDRSMVIGIVRLLHKSVGAASGEWNAGD